MSSTSDDDPRPEGADRDAAETAAADAAPSGPAPAEAEASGPAPAASNPFAAAAAAAAERERAAAAHRPHRHRGRKAEKKKTTAEGEEDVARPSRRGFLRTAGFSAIGAAVGAAAGFAGGVAVTKSNEPANPESAQDYLPELAVPGKPTIDHYVVLMYENRSFDNILGYLYDEDSLPKGQTFDGLNFGRHGNPDPITERMLYAHPYDGPTDQIMSMPRPDPGEEYPHVNTQLFGTVDPPENANLSAEEMVAPYNAPQDQSHPDNSGFVLDYVNQWKRHHGGQNPPYEIYSQVMGSFTPQMLPVFSTLAKNFAVYDAWFAAVPSQTYCNRSFFNASTSHGYVTNKRDGHQKWLKHPKVPTIFNRLEDAGRTWRVYFDERQLISLTGFIHAPATQQYWKTNFRPMSEFYQDAASGDLPDYAFIEPRLLFDHNDMHPPVGVNQATNVDGQPIQSGSISDVRAGEALLHNVYNAIRKSASSIGSNALNTMLLVTFDEHGGTYDHVAPPATVPPDTSSKNEMDFGFDRLGLRLPTIAISAWTQRGSVIHDVMHHGSMIATLCKKYDMPYLTQRDRTARTVENAINRKTPRQPRDWPQTHPQWLPENPEAFTPIPGNVGDDRPLSTPGSGLMGMLMTFAGLDGQQAPRTYAEAYELVVKHGAGLFGTADKSKDEPVEK